jgi:hypothetical protein
MANLIGRLKTRGVDTAFAAFQLDFSELLVKRVTRATARAYEHHDWVVLDDPLLGRVVNAVPRKAMIEELHWEQWCRKDGTTHHRILSLARPSRWDDVFIAPDHDDAHPPAVFGRTWYMVEDPDMCPLLLRKTS